jgi:signal transduction histidine kinase
MDPQKLPVSMRPDSWAPEPTTTGGTPRSIGEARYAEVNRRLSALNAVGAASIVLLTVLSIWGDTRKLVLVGVLQVAVIAFNTWFNLVWLPKKGPSAELLRAFVNISTCLVVNRVSGWPLAVWLWLPYVALAFDHMDRRVAKWTLIGFCAAQNGLSLYDGVSWEVPALFTVLAIFASEVSRLRFAIIGDMLFWSDRQRVEIERSHRELAEAHEKLKNESAVRERVEQDLRQAQKLEAVGRLAAGVAHEINTPVQFVGDSIHFLREATTDLMGVVERLRAVEAAVMSGAPALEAAIAARAAEEAADLPYVVENVPKAFDRAVEGLSRVTTIVRSMKEFAHPGGKEMAPVDLNSALEATLVIARNEYKYVADLETDFEELPPVMCHIGDLNQALLNMIVNAAHAIGDVVNGTDQRGRLLVKTWREGDDALIAIRDTGTGIPEAIQDRVFDPFFTTKPVGQGTGQGLSIAHSVVVEKHRGQLSFMTEPGNGTTFLVRLPIRGARASTPQPLAAE